MNTETDVAPSMVVGTWTLTSSLIHGGDETLGTTKLFRTKGMVVEGRKVQIPVVSGNAIRGIWRRHSARAFLDAYLAAGGTPLSLSAFYYLTSGGSLKKGAETTSLDLGAERALRELVPFIGLFGGAGLGKIQAGKLWVDEAVPVCRETLPLLRRLWPAAEEADTAAMSVRELTEIHGYSRQDDAKDERWHGYLNTAGRQDATALVRRTQEDVSAPSAGAPQQMRYENMELVAGTVLLHRWGFRWSPMHTELASFAAGLLRWAADPRVGGRSAVGHGSLLLDYHGVRADVRLLTDGEGALATLAAQRPEDVLREHVAARRDDITRTLAAL